MGQSASADDRHRRLQFLRVRVGSILLRAPIQTTIGLCRGLFRAPERAARRRRNAITVNQLFGNQFWIFLLVFGFGAASWLIRQLQEQARIRQAKERAKRQYEEQLRTGRPPEAATPASREPRLPRPDDLIARRQAQLNELRRRQTQGSPLAGHGMVVKAPTSPRAPGAGVRRPGGAVPPSGVVIQRIPGGAPTPAPPRRPAPVRPARSPGELRPINPGGQLDEARRRQQLQREADMRQLELQERARVEAERRRRAAEAAAEERQQERTRVSPVSSPVSPLHGPDGRLKSPAELRDFLVASEILSRPMCDRIESD